MNTPYLTIERGSSYLLCGDKTRDVPMPKTIRVGTFNMLAPCWKRLDSGRESSFEHIWKPRIKRLIKELKKHKFHILMLQEFWFEGSYKNQFVEAFGNEYDMYFLQRGNKKPDGLLTLISAEKMPSVQEYIGLDYNDFGSRVAQILCFCDVRVINTHLTFPHPNPYDPIMRRYQAIKLSDFMNTQPQKFYIVGGDFNGSIEDPAVQKILSRANLKPMREDSNFFSHLSHNKEQMACDLILCSQRGSFSQVDIGPLNMDISDHAMVFANVNRVDD